MVPTLNKIAADIAPELSRLIDKYLERMRLGSDEYNMLIEFLWDNKVGLLRLAEGYLNRAEKIVSDLVTEAHERHAANGMDYYVALYQIAMICTDNEGVERADPRLDFIRRISERAMGL